MFLTFEIYVHWYFQEYLEIQYLQYLEVHFLYFRTENYIRYLKMKMLGQFYPESF